MTNGSVILHQNASLYSPISVLHYEYYDDAATRAATLRTNESVQCLVGMDHIPFGQAQKPELTDFADGIDTLQFLLSFWNFGKTLPVKIRSFFIKPALSDRPALLLQTKAPQAAILWKS